MTLIEFLVGTPSPCGALVCTTCGGALGFHQTIRDYLSDPDTPPVFDALCALNGTADPRIRDAGSTVTGILAALRLRRQQRWRDLAHGWAVAAEDTRFASTLIAWLPQGIELSPVPRTRERQLLHWIFDLRGVPPAPHSRPNQDPHRRSGRPEGPRDGSTGRAMQPRQTELPLDAKDK